MPRKPVLVVDDDESNRALLDAILSDEGYSVEMVDGGAEAIELLQTRHYAAVLLDMLMPFVDGFDVIQFLIRTNPRLLERVIVVSALGDRFVANFDPTLVHAFVRKPFDRHELVQTVHECTALTDVDDTIS